MEHIIFPDASRERQLPFYLAAEEYLARNFSEDFFFHWRVGPTVIFGRNQDMEAEADAGYCRREGIRMFRRKSGGGCVYADMGNLMLSAVTTGSDRPFLFYRFMSTLALALRRLDIDAWPSGRNDILVSGRKISGSAVYGIGNRNIIHATLLYDADLEKMQKALTPSPRKLASKGIASVRQRVANISGLTELGIEEIGSSLAGFFCRGDRILTDSDTDLINEIMKTYLDDRFIRQGNLYGNTEKNMPV